MAALAPALPALKAVGTVLGIVSAIGGIQAGQAQKRQYELQAQQTEVESQRRAIQYGQRSNDVLRRRMQVNAAIAARAYAGGVDPFSGSPDLVRAANDTVAGREYARLLEDADAAIRSGAFQAEVYREAGATAKRTAYFSAATKLATIAASSAGDYLDATQAPAPIESRSFPSTTGGR
jgi:hypothetical protein